MNFKNIGVKFLIVCIILLCFQVSAIAQSPYISRVIEYRPAPGQFINTAIGNAQAAQSLVGGVNGSVSLGNFGGYIIVGFDHTIENHPNNPYGVDFNVFGNAMPGSSEPGGVMVMKDSNANGLADDTWYTLAGSEYYKAQTIRNYTVGYRNSDEAIAWYDNKGDTGTIIKNSFHSQPYYPLPNDFPAIDNVQYSLTGVCIFPVFESATPPIVTATLPFGYCDNRPVIQGVSHLIPDNPYTSAIEGCGGDGMDIDWAVDSLGNSVKLDGIDFIKIYTATNEQVGWLGELSTEISGIADVAPNPEIIGNTKLIVLKNMERKVLVGKQINLEAPLVFEKGKPANYPVRWTTNNSQIASIINDSFLLVKNTDKFKLIAQLTNDTAVSTQILMEAIIPTFINLENINTLKPEQVQKLNLWVEDNNHQLLPDVKTGITSSDTSIISVFQSDGNWFISAKKTGVAFLTVHAIGYENVTKTIEITVSEILNPITITISLQTTDEVLFDQQKLVVGFMPLKNYIDRPMQNYSDDKQRFISPAHVIAQLFVSNNRAGEFKFRDDENGANKLYLWQVINDGWYYYGHGGAQKTGFYNGWIIQLNHSCIINDINSTPIKDGDILKIYQIDDVTKSWSRTELQAENIFARVGYQVSFTLADCTYKMQSDRSISKISESPKIGQVVFVNGEALYFDNKPVETDNNGKFTIRFVEAGLQKITCGGQSLSINVQPNNPPIVVNPIGDRAIDKSTSIEVIDLINVFSDSDSENSTSVLQVTGNSNPAMLDAYIDANRFLVLVIKQNMPDKSNITIRYECDGLSVTHSFTVTILPDSVSYLNHESEFQNVMVYPNPATDKFQIYTGFASRQLLEVYDCYGKLVYSNDFSTQLLTIDCSAWQTGLYFLKLTNKQGSISRKLIKR